jgi:hypothetical protein
VNTVAHDWGAVRIRRQRGVRLAAVPQLCYTLVLHSESGNAVTAAPLVDAAEQWPAKADALVVVELPKYVNMSVSPKVLC